MSMKKFFIIVTCLLVVFIGMFVGLSVLGGQLSDEDTIWNARKPGSENQIMPRAEAVGNLSAGVFLGTGGGGHYGEVSVEITVDQSGRITAVEVVDSHETPRFAGPAFEHLIPAVINSQTHNVDVFVGATQSSTAFLNAVADAIRVSSGAAPEEPAVVVRPDGAVFTGRSSAGHGGDDGDLFVEVIISDDGEIVFIEVTRHSETPGFANPAFEALIERVLAAQSTDVDIHTGSTYTSRAFLEAVERALGHADN